MRMPFAPSEVIFASAWTWLVLSTSLLPAAVRSFTFSSPAVSFAAVSIRVQNGLVSRLTMSPTVTFGLFEPPPAATPDAAADPSATEAVLKRKGGAGGGDAAVVVRGPGDH